MRKGRNINLSSNAARPLDPRQVARSFCTPPPHTVLPQKRCPSSARNCTALSTAAHKPTSTQRTLKAVPQLTGSRSHPSKPPKWTFLNKGARITRRGRGFTNKEAENVHKGATIFGGKHVNVENAQKGSLATKNASRRSPMCKTPHNIKKRVHRGQMSALKQERSGGFLARGSRRSESPPL